MEQLTLSKKEKYNVSQKIFEELANAVSRTIIFSIIDEAKSGLEISSDYKIPLSTVYKKISDLEKLSLIFAQREELTEQGRPMKLYRSRVKKAKIIIEKPQPHLALSPNQIYK